MRLKSRAFRDPRSRRFLFFAALLGILGFTLAPVTTTSALLALPLAGSVAYIVCDVLSHLVTGRRLVFPSRLGWNTPGERGSLRWSDHALAVVAGALTVLGLFVVGEFVDCVRDENVWHGEPLVRSWCQGAGQESQ